MTTSVATAASGMPMLSRGTHLRPEDGACLMEYVSVLAGEPFSDHPRCTHRVLGELDHLVNDAVAAQTRAGLAVLAPDLIGTAIGDPRVAPTVRVCCLRAALAASPQEPYLLRRLERAQLRLARLTTLADRRRSDWGWCSRVASPTFSISFDFLLLVSRSDSDQAFPELLKQAITGCHQLATAPLAWIPVPIAPMKGSSTGG